MKRIESIFVLVVLLMNSLLTVSQSKGGIPEIPGYTTLKCDFHLHTVFSDGSVWPNLRVNEAVRDGLDVIAMTDHIDYEGFPEFIDKDYNKPYEIAKKAAEGKGLIVINGGEISPRVSPYHNNAIFLKDVNKLPIDYMKETKKKFVMKDNIKKEALVAPFLEAQRQDAFVFYNHPGYSWWDKKDTAIFTNLHKELFDKGIIKGVEVVNGRYNIIAHRIAEEYNLTMFGNSDAHGDVYYTYRHSHRPMTLVFAKDKSEEGVKEALLARRTAVYVDDYIIARQPEAEAFFKASLEIEYKRRDRNGEPILEVTVLNNSEIPYSVRIRSGFEVESYPLGQLVLTPSEPVTFILKELWNHPSSVELLIDVFNIVVSPEKNLQTKILIDKITLYAKDL